MHPGSALARGPGRPRQEPSRGGTGDTRDGPGSHLCCLPCRALWALGDDPDLTSRVSHLSLRRPNQDARPTRQAPRGPGTSGSATSHCGSLSTAAGGSLSFSTPRETTKATPLEAAEAAPEPRHPTWGRRVGARGRGGRHHVRPLWGLQRPLPGPGAGLTRPWGRAGEAGGSDCGTQRGLPARPRHAAASWEWWPGMARSYFCKHAGHLHFDIKLAGSS